MDDDGHVCLTDFGLSKIVGKDESVYNLILINKNIIKKKCLNRLWVFVEHQNI